ncbi:MULTISPECIES: helix-turn-helix domain-containing protein [Paenibacillus]|uniref:helix-turn-helix domain-containing protein n=1 Tax=Paenibacillus TaxID=44249 RepID=UPI00096F6C6C|nr:helix-turn-helix domain-containing protein [Paenibacillus odorifer]OMD07760.1 hypothetical protein BJP50_31445 [Paenibacillus odorifer]
MSETLAKKKKRLGRTPRRKTEIQQRQQEKHERLERIKNKDQAEKIKKVEREFNRLSYTLDKQQLKDSKDNLLTYPVVVNLINGYATRWGKRYKNNRLTREDFLSAFYEIAWTIVMDYSWLDPYYLYEQLKKGIQSRGKDILRSSKYDKRRAFHDSLSLKEGFEDFYPDNYQLEDMVMLKLYKEELNSLEQDVFNIINDGGSQREAAKELRKDRRTIRKTVNRVQEKYDSYRSVS